MPRATSLPHHHQQPELAADEAHGKDPRTGGAQCISVEALATETRRSILISAFPQARLFQPARSRGRGRCAPASGPQVPVSGR